MRVLCSPPARSRARRRRKRTRPCTRPSALNPSSRSFSSARRRSALSTSFPPSSRTRCSCTPRSSQRNAAGRARKRTPSAGTRRVSAGARRGDGKTRAAAGLRRLALGFGHDLLVLGVPVFISFLSVRVRVRSESRGETRRPSSTRSHFFFFPRRGVPPFPSRSAGSLVSPKSARAPARRRSRARRATRDRSTATVGVISAVTPSQYPGCSGRRARTRPGGARPRTATRANRKRRRAPPRVRFGGRRAKGEARRAGAPPPRRAVSRDWTVTARCAGRSALDAASVAPVGVTMTLSEIGKRGIFSGEKIDGLFFLRRRVQQQKTDALGSGHCATRVLPAACRESRAAASRSMSFPSPGTDLRRTWTRTRTVKAPFVAPRRRRRRGRPGPGARGVFRARERPRRTRRARPPAPRTPAADFECHAPVTLFRRCSRGRARGGAPRRRNRRDARSGRISETSRGKTRSASSRMRSYERRKNKRARSASSPCPRTGPSGVALMPAQRRWRKPSSKPPILRRSARSSPTSESRNNCSEARKTRIGAVASSRRKGLRPNQTRRRVLS